MNPRVRRTRTRTESDIEVLRRELLDPRGVCIRCLAICVPKAVFCDKCRAKETTNA